MAWLTLCKYVLESVMVMKLKEDIAKYDKKYIYIYI